MRERHNWGTGKHPKSCTCAVCQSRRVEAAAPKVKKKRKPKSQRGKGGKASKAADQSAAIDAAMDILGLSAGETSEPESNEDAGK